MKTFTFVDTQNLLKTFEANSWILDYSKLFDYIKNDLKSEKVILFFGYNNKNKKLYQELENIGYELVFRPMYNGKANVDNDIVLHAVDRLNKYDAFILISNDGDFYNLIKYLKEKNKFRNIVSPARITCSKLLRKISDNKIIFADDILIKITEGVKVSAVKVSIKTQNTSE